MHELSIARSLVSVTEEAARDAGAVRVGRVYLRLGALAGVVQESLAFAWDFATAGTLLEGSDLVVEPVPVEVRCDHCGHEGPPVSRHRMRCNACDAPTPHVLHGRELVVRAIDYDEAPLAPSRPSPGAPEPHAASGAPVPSPAAPRQPHPAT